MQEDIRFNSEYIFNFTLIELFLYKIFSLCPLLSTHAPLPRFIADVGDVRSLQKGSIQLDYNQLGCSEHSIKTLNNVGFSHMMTFYDRSKELKPAKL